MENLTPQVWGYIAGTVSLFLILVAICICQWIYYGRCTTCGAPKTYEEDE